MPKFQADELVWALYEKYKVLPWPWPGKIMVKTDADPPSKPGEYYYVYFFIHNKHDFVKKEYVFKYLDHVNDFATPPRKNRAFSAAAKYIHEQYWCLIDLKREALIFGGFYISPEDRKQMEREDKKAHRLRSVRYLEGDDELSRPLKRLKREAEAHEYNPPEFTHYVPYIEDNSNLPIFIEHEDVKWEFLKEDRETVPLFNCRKYDIRTVAKFPNWVRATCRECNVNYGFIGLLSANKILIRSILSRKRHVVNFWSKISFKYEAFLSLGAVGRNTPEDVILSSDIIFCTMPDEDVSLHFKYTTTGIFDGLAKSAKSGKIYVCIIGLDVEPDQEMKKAVIKFGCNYFEVRVGFIRDNLRNKQPVFLCAGHPAVYQKIKSYLLYATDDIHYLGTTFDVRRDAKVPDCLVTRVKFKSTPIAYAIIESLGYKFQYLNKDVESCYISRLP